MENKLELVQEMPQEEQTVTVLDVINDCIGRLDTLTYNNEEVKKFGIVIGTVRDNLFACATAMVMAERKAKHDAPAVDAETIAEVKRFEEAEQDGNSEA